MAYQEVKTTGYGTRVGNSFKGIFSGLILFCLATALLWWNEGRAVKTDKAGWRYGFVALQEDGTRVYGDMFTEPTGKASFTVPEQTTKLWFVVLGAPTEHWHHPWDMGNDDVFTAANLADDEQWPYRVRFIGATRN